MITVGLDLGQQQDHTAIAIVEREQPRLSWMPAPPPLLRVRYLERLPLGTPYAQVVKRVSSIMHHPKLASGTRLVVDATGVGRPIVELLRAARLPGTLTSVTITGGDAATGQGGEWQVPRKDLLGGLLALLEQGQLKLPQTLSATAPLLRELTSLQTRHTPRARVQLETAEHDDLAIALALACWKPYAGTIGFGTQRLPGI
jgi:hypothetical protein